MTEGPGGFMIRPAREGDLDVITGFEIDIARESFGAEAIEDPALHRKRVAAALGKPGEVTLVAVTEADAEAPVGWAWLSGRTNSLTGARYGNFRSLATATSLGEASIPEQEAPRRRASSMARPDPHATSSSRSPASTPSRWCRATYSRQLLGSLSAEKSTALRPQPSSTVADGGRPWPGLVMTAPRPGGHRPAAGCDSRGRWSAGR